MAKLMWICGILLVAAGLALGIVAFVAIQPPGGVDVHAAAILLVGGVLALGLGSVIDGQAQTRAHAHSRPLVPEPVIPAAAPAAIPAFDPRSSKQAATEAVAATAATAAAASVIVEEEVSRPTRDTIQKLEQARQKIEQAFEARTAAPPPPVEEPAAVEEVAEVVVAAAEEPEAVEDEAVEEEVVAEEEIVAEEEVVEDGQLYVVEERIIRRHPARILSDGTVEAETSEGWMRFENLEHLDEYLDATEPARG